MTRVRLLPEALEDLRHAARFYEHEAPDLGVAFASAVEHSLSLLRDNPAIGSILPDGARKLVVRRFPFLIVYRILPDEVLVLAIGHQRRHPGFWRTR